MGLERELLVGLDGHQIPLYRWSLNKSHQSPRATVQIVHGMAEHSMRYSEVANVLADHGIIAYASDHRGHGAAIQSGEPGHFSDSGGWRKAVDDLHVVRRRIEQDSPNTPNFLLGHSMGSFLAQDYIARWGEGLRGAILTGSNYTPKVLANLFRWIAQAEVWRQGPMGQSSLIRRLSFTKYNDRFRPNRTDFDWLSRDAKEVDKYIADPLCGFDCTNQLWLDLLGGLGGLFARNQGYQIPGKLSVLLMSGEQDPVQMGKSAIPKLAEKIRESGSRDVSFHLFSECRHELFNEIHRQAAFAMLLEWIEARIS